MVWCQLVTYKNKLQTKKVLIYVDVDVHCTINYMIRMEVMTNIDIGVQIWTQIINAYVWLVQWKNDLYWVSTSVPTNERLIPLPDSEYTAI